MTHTATKSAETYTTVSAEEFARRIKSADVYLIDVRTAEEYADGHIEGARNLDVTKESFVEDAKRMLPKDKVIAVYCGSGKRSAVASGKLAAEGYRVLNLDGGFAAWKEAGLQ